MWFAAAFFFLVFQWSVIINVDASRCSSKPIYYASECLEMKECAWCCELPVGRQCLPRRGPESIHSTCSSSAILDYNMTCGELCSTRFNDCGECELKNWCYFCISSSMCQPPYMECPGNSVIQSCDMRRRQPTGNMFYFEVITAVGAALCGAALIASLILVGLRVRQRIREDRPSLTEESVSLLNNGSRAPPHGINQNNYNDRSNNNNNNNNNNSNNRNNSGSNDTARTLATREEVDATVNTFTTAATLHAVSPIRNRENTEVHLTPRSTKVSTGEDEGVCFLCLDASPSVTFLPCYHTCCCEECSNKLRPTRGDVLTCPFCRTKIVSMWVWLLGEEKYRLASMAWRRRYKVVEKGGGVGEVVQVAVRDVGVNAGENTPPLHITSLIEQHGKRNMAAKGGTVGGRDGLPCLSCAQYQDRIVQLEAQLQFTEKQMQVNNILNAMMNSLATQHNVSNASALSIAKGTRGTRTPSSRRRQRKKQQQEQQEKTPECEDEDEEQPTLLEMMQEELRRQDLLHALMNLLERPTTLEAARSGERLVPEYVKGLLMGIPEH